MVALLCAFLSLGVNGPASAAEPSRRLLQLSADGLEQIASERDAEGKEYELDPESGAVAKTRFGLGLRHVVEITRDAVDREIRRETGVGETSPEVLQFVGTDAAGRQTSKTRVQEQFTEEYAYGDALGRLTRRTRSGPKTLTEERVYREGATSEVVITETIQDGTPGTRTRTLELDALDRVLVAHETVDGQASRTEWVYDARGQIREEKAPDESGSPTRIMTYTYDEAGHLLEVRHE